MPDIHDMCLYWNKVLLNKIKCKLEKELKVTTVL